MITILFGACTCMCILQMSQMNCTLYLIIIVQLQTEVQYKAKDCLFLLVAWKSKNSYRLFTQFGLDLVCMGGKKRKKKKHYQYVHLKIQVKKTF